MMTSDEVRATALNMIEKTWDSPNIVDVMATMAAVVDLIEASGYRVPQDGTAFLCDGVPLQRI